MEQYSESGIQGGTGQNAMGLLGQKRTEAIAKATRRQFYESDRVKQFHRILLLTETLKERDEQLEMKQRMESASNEEAKKCMVKLRHKELEAVEQERERTNWKKKERAAVTEGLRQQLRENELVRQLGKIESEKEVKKSQEIQEKYEREKADLQKMQQERKGSIRKAHEAHMAMKDAIRVKEAQKHDMEEEKRRLIEKEKETRISRNRKEEKSKYIQLEKHRQSLAEQLSVQLQEKNSKEMAQEAKVVEQAKAQHDAELECESRKHAKTKAMMSAIATRREDIRSMQAQRAADEQQCAQETLKDNKRADCAYWEEQQLTKQKKKADRSSMDESLRQQMAEKCSKVHLVKQELTDIERKNAQLLMEEEEQFQQYAAGVIKVAEEANRNTCHLRKAANQDIVCGLGPITGGIRSSYLLSEGGSQVPDYISSTNQDIKMLYTGADTRNNKRLDFIW